MTMFSLDIYRHRLPLCVYFENFMRIEIEFSLALKMTLLFLLGNYIVPFYIKVSLKFCTEIKMYITGSKIILLESNIIILN